jgi:hypothetical protein
VQLLWIELAGEHRRVNQIAEQHGELATFRLGGGRDGGWRVDLRHLFFLNGPCRQWWDGLPRLPSATRPHQHAAVLILGNLLRVKEFVLKGLQGVVVQVELHLECPIGKEKSTPLHTRARSAGWT